MTFRVVCDDGRAWEFNHRISAEVVEEIYTLQGQKCRIEGIDIDEELARIRPLPGLPQTPRRTKGLGALQR